MEKNVMIFIDYENIHKNLIKEKQNALGSFFFDKIRVWCNNRKLRILDIKVYCNFDIEDLYLSHHQSKLQEYGLETFHTANKGKNYADLKITSDLLEELYENSNIDGFIIISNDKDMTPLIKIIKRYKEFVYLFTNKDCYDSTLKNFPDELFILEDEVLNIANPKESEKEYKKIQDNFILSLEKYYDDTFTKQKNPTRSLDYILESNIKYFKLPEYELLSHIKNAIEEDKLIVHEYTYSSKTYRTICPDSKKDICISSNYIEEKNILDKTQAIEFLEKEIEKIYSNLKNKFF